MRQYFGFVNMNRELDVEIMEEITPLDISVKQDGKGNAPSYSRILRENMDVTELIKKTISRVNRR
jgi:hypothetical protein